MLLSSLRFLELYLTCPVLRESAPTACMAKPLSGSLGGTARTC
jgi:hypothetical protein